MECRTREVNNPEIEMFSRLFPIKKDSTHTCYDGIVEPMNPQLAFWHSATVDLSLEVYVNAEQVLHKQVLDEIDHRDN